MAVKRSSHPRPNASEFADRLRSQFITPLFSDLTRTSAEPSAGVLAAIQEAHTPPVEAAPVVAAPALTARPSDPLDARLQVSGPSPLMVEAYRDLHATADKLVAANISTLNLSAGAIRLYSFLVLCALGNARARGLPRVPSVASLHLPMDLLALALEVNRSTVHRWAEELGWSLDRETGVITGHGLAVRWDHKTSSAPVASQKAVEAQQKRNAQKGRKTSAARPGVSDGVVWAVSMTGPRAGLRVPEEALRFEYRDLLADSVAAGKNKGSAQGLRTVWALKNAGLQQSLEGLKAQNGAELAVRWSVNPGFKSQTPLIMTVARTGEALGAVWDAQSVRGLRRSEQAAAVDSAAKSLAAIYGDWQSVGMYQWVLWRLLRLETVGVNLWDVVLLVMDKVRGDLLAGDCTNAGALLMWRLKARPEGGGESLWDQLKDAYQVAPRGGVWA